MSCYTRHLEDFLPVGAKPADKRALDAAVRRAIGAPAEADCPQVWAEVKERRRHPAFVASVRAEMERGT